MRYQKSRRWATFTYKNTIWAIFGNNRNAELDLQSKVAVNTAWTKDAELNEDLNKFWEYDSIIELTGSKGGLSQNDMECLKKLDQSSLLVDGK